MSAVKDAAAQLERDARMTAHRTELKYAVPLDLGRTLVRELDLHLAPHRHVGTGANRLPEPQHHVTTVYFDTASRALYRASLAHEKHIKLRAKEYYDLHPGLLETATDPKQLVRYQPTLWLEVKSRDGGQSTKRRIGIPKHDVPAFFTRGEISAEMIELQTPAFGDAARSVLKAVAELCASCGEPLRADCLVNYRRKAWQDDAGQTRITLDREIAFYPPPADLWTREWALTRRTLGPATGSEARVIVEVKLLAEAPPWLAQLLAAHAMEPIRYSKFESAAACVHA
jgi:hypothetical protein